MRQTFRIALALFLGATGVLPVLAADGVPVMPFYHGEQARPGLAPDGQGGAWLAFQSGASQVGVAHLAPNGLVIPDGSLAVRPVQLNLDPAWPAIVLSGAPDRVFVAANFCSYDRLLQGWSLSGDPVPSTPGASSMYYRYPAALRLEDGRYLLAAPGSLTFNVYGIHYAFVSADGELLSETAAEMGYQTAEEANQAVSDGAGGMILSVPIYSTPDYSSGRDVSIQRLAANGTRAWGNNGKILCAVSGNQDRTRLAADGSGGVFVTWTDGRTNPAASPLDVYATRYDGTGTRMTGWVANGTRVTNVAGAQFDSRIVPDGAGGAWILWRDQRVTDIDLYFTRLTGSGAFAPGFTTAGTLLCGATGDADFPQMVPDGEGGFFAVWIDPRNGNPDVYAQHITSAGAPAAGWPANGLALCDDPSFQSALQVLATSTGHALVAWRDSRGTAGEVRVVGLEPSGPITADAPGMLPVPLRLRPATNPSVGAPVLRLTAFAGERVELELLDVAGRILRRTEAPGDGGEVLVRFPGAPLASGVYFVRARQGARNAGTRICVLR